MKKYILVAIVTLYLVCGCNFCNIFADETLSLLPQITVKNRKIYINEKEFFIRGVSYALSYPKTVHYSQIPKEILEKDFQMMKEVGINTIRTYQPMPDIVLNLAEQYNIMVIENVVYPGSWTDFNSRAELEELKNTAIKNIIRHKDKKCILAWDIWNDAPFTYGPGGRNIIKKYGEENLNRFLEEIYQTIKEIDPNRPITGSNLIYSEESLRLGAGFLDILSYNTYLGIYDWLGGKFSDEKAKETVELLQVVSSQYDKPVIIAETGYSSYCKGATQGEVIQKQIQMAGNALAGIIIFEWADEWGKAGKPYQLNNHIEEHWGIVDGYRNPKDGYYKLKEIYKNH